jgi:hypothetical protein
MSAPANRFRLYQKRAELEAPHMLKARPPFFVEPVNNDGFWRKLLQKNDMRNNLETVRLYRLIQKQSEVRRW